MLCLSLYKLIYLCCSVVDHISVFHYFILSFLSFFLFPLSILFHDWQRAFLVNKAIFHLISTSFSSSSSSTPLRVLPPNSPSLLPSTFLLLLSHLLGWWSNQCLNQTWAEGWSYFALRKNKPILTTFKNGRDAKFWHSWHSIPYHNRFFFAS